MNPPILRIIELRLAALKLTGSRITLDDFTSFYNTFLIHKNNLRMCDNSVKESTFVAMFIKALPTFLSNGVDVHELNRKKDVHEVYNTIYDTMSIREAQRICNHFDNHHATINANPLVVDSEATGSSTLEKRHVVLVNINMKR